MNGASAPCLWQEAKHPDGRVYYYHLETNITQWDKPDELISSSERALKNQPWKEYTAEGGRKYWYNTETKLSVWEMPEAFKNAIAQGETHHEAATPSQTFVAGGAVNFHHQFQSSRERDDHHTQDRIGVDRQLGFDNTRHAPAAAPQHEPEYGSLEDAESAFTKALKRASVQPDWTWNQAMRATIRDPQYKALRNSKERKAAFEKYVVEARLQGRDRERERLAKLRADFTTMLQTHSEIKHFTRWKVARPMLEAETIFKSAQSEDEQRQLFEEYIIGLKKSHIEAEAETRKAALDKLTSILQSLNLEPYTRWSEAESIIQSHEGYQNDEKFKTLNKLDNLKAFESHIKSLERSFNDARQKQKQQTTRSERQARDRFLELLGELKDNGLVKAGTKWAIIEPKIENDPRYVAILALSGSTPLDLFWDTIEEEERVLRSKRNEVLDVLDDKRFEITTKTSFDQFASIMQTDRRTASIDSESMSLIFKRLREKVIKRSDDDKHHAERIQRRAVEALRSKIKHLDPPVQPSESWEQVRPRVEQSDEFRAIDTEDLRRSAFEKVVRRLREKDDDQDRDRGKRENRDRRDNRDRDYRNSHGGDSGRRFHTRTPEPDAYEADRQRAQADRERQYRKSSTTGLSPPARRNRDDRDRYERPSSNRLVGPSHYDRERKERESERERAYVSRADPRDRGSALDYGDSRPSSTRRQRDSEDDSPLGKRDNKRPKTDKSLSDRPLSPSSPQPGIAKEDPALRSGSEEGEIEED